MAVAVGARPSVAVLAAAGAAAAAAILLKHAAFPLLSIDNDEAINALFADTLARGRLFPPTGGAADAFRPWLAAVSGDHYVLKYTPVVPALLAGSLILTGGPGLYLAALAATNVVVTSLLAEEVLGDRAEALVATALVALSPLVVVHSALLLSYLPTFVLLEAFAWALLRGVARGRPWLFGVSGLAIGLAFFVRSFDAVVFAAPLLVWAVTGARRRRLGAGAVAWFLGLAAIPVAAFAAFNTAASGSPLGLTFSMLEPLDTVGFGSRRLYPTDAVRHFGVVQGLNGTLRHGLLLGWWAAGGPILGVLALATLARRRISGAAWPVVAAGALIPPAYLFFWGPWNATVVWGGTRYLGPFYFMAVLLPLGLCGARGLVDLHRWRPAAGIAVALAMCALTAAVIAAAVEANVRFTGDERALERLVVGHSPRQLVFVRSDAAPFLMHPAGVVSNRSDLDGPVLYAVQQGDDDLDLALRLADRTPYRLRFDGSFTRPGKELTGRLDQLRVVTGSRLELRLQALAPPGPGLVAVEVSAGAVATVYPMPQAGLADQHLVVTAAGAALDGQPPQRATPRSTPGTDLEVRLLRWPAAGAEPVVEATERLPLRADGPDLRLLEPAGPSWTTGRVAPALLEVTA